MGILYIVLVFQLELVGLWLWLCLVVLVLFVAVSILVASVPLRWLPLCLSLERSLCATSPRLLDRLWQPGWLHVGEVLEAGALWGAIDG